MVVPDGIVAIRARLDRLTPLTVDELEAHIDGYWMRTPLPDRERDVCTFGLLAQFERLVANAMFSPDPNENCGDTDGLKYALRNALDLASRHGGPSLGPPYAFNPALASAYSAVLRSADEYESARLAFSCYRAGLAAYAEIDGGLAFTRPKDVQDHEAVDVLFAQASDSPFVSAFVLAMLNYPSPWRELGRRSFTVNRRMAYDFVRPLGVRLYDHLPHGTALIPDGWMAWGLKHSELSSILHALGVRCAYHALTVRGWRDKVAPSPPLQSDIVLITTKKTLVSELSMLCGCAAASVERFVEILEYGSGTKTPDPALQPIIPLGTNVIAVPCYLILSSHRQRNCLSLQSRTESSVFDAQSSVFEQQMFAELRRVLDHSDLLYACGLKSANGEIDVILGSDSVDALIVLELKWLLPAGDVREMINRQTRVNEGGKQLVSRMESVANNLPQYSKLIGKMNVATRVIGLLACEGYHSHCEEPGVDTIPFRVLRSVLGRGLSSSEVLDVLLMQQWIPTLGKDYESIEVEHLFGQYRLRWFGYAATAAGRQLAASLSSETSED